MLWAYILEVGKDESSRTNAPVFQLIKELEIEDANCFFDIDGTGSRPELKDLLEQIQHGDRLIVRSAVDLADTIEELINTLTILTEKQITLCSYAESYLCGENYLRQIKGIGSIYQHFNVKKKADAYKQAVAEGKVGRPSKAKEVDKAVELFKANKVTMEQLQALTGLSKSTLYRYIKNN